MLSEISLMIYILHTAISNCCLDKQICLVWHTLSAWVAKLKWNRLVDSYVMGNRIERGKKRLTCSRKNCCSVNQTERLYSPPNTQWQIRFYREIDSISNPIVKESDK